MSDELSQSDYEAMMAEGKFPEGIVEFAELMIKDERIPEPIKEMWWGFLNKDTILTRSDGINENWEAANDFAIRRNLQLMCQPAYKNDIIEIVELDNVRRRFITQHRRSIQGFERQALMTQIRELRSNRPTPEASSGLWSGIKKKLGFGPKKEAEHGTGTG